MERVAIFVDAGYLYAAGSVALVSSKQSRVNLSLNISKAIDNLKSMAKAKTGDCSLLRIYWYDGVPPQGPSYEQQELANSDDVKLRLGVINPYGQQKGVDSLIVTDLVELARNQAITDAVLLSGDEDVRIGVQIAQSFGVRIHLIGIEPSRGNQANTLRQESDTTTEMNKADVQEFLTFKGRSGFTISAVPATVTQDLSVDELSAGLDQSVAEFVASRDSSDLAHIAGLGKYSMLPREFDAPLLAICRTKIGRNLEDREKRYVRDKLKEQARLNADSN